MSSFVVFFCLYQTIFKYMFIYLIRHWQTKANINDICSWHLETPLTRLWIKQAWVTWAALKSVKFDVIFSSDLSRAYDTAKNIIWEQEVITTPLLRERCYHHYEWTDWLIKKHAEELWLIPSRYRELWWNRPEYPIESNEEMMERWNEFTSKYVKNTNHGKHPYHITWIIS